MTTGSWVPDLLGALGGTLTTIAFVPQMIKTLRSRSTRDISLITWLAFSAGLVFWIVYGMLVGAWPIIAANLITLAMSLVILRIKLANLAHDRTAERRFEIPGTRIGAGNASKGD